VHLNTSTAQRTLCGLSVHGLKTTHVVDQSTCRTCWRADDALQIRNHRAECKAARIDPDTMEKIK
jgi:hypothetical protein